MTEYAPTGLYASSGPSFPLMVLQCPPSPASPPGPDGAGSVLSIGSVLCPTLSPCTPILCLHISGSSEPPVPKFPSMEFADSTTLPTPAPDSPVVPELNSIMNFPMLLPFSPVYQLLKPETHIFVPGTPGPHTMVSTGTFLSNLMDSEKDDQSPTRLQALQPGHNLSAQSLFGTSPRKWHQPPPLILAAETQESFLVPLSSSTTHLSPSSRPVHSIVSHLDHRPTLTCSPAVCSTFNDVSHICK